MSKIFSRVLSPLITGLPILTYTRILPFPFSPVLHHFRIKFLEKGPANDPCVRWKHLYITSKGQANNPLSSADTSTCGEIPPGAKPGAQHSGAASLAIPTDKPDNVPHHTALQPLCLWVNPRGDEGGKKVSTRHNIKFNLGLLGRTISTNHSLHMNKTISSHTEKGEIPKTCNTYEPLMMYQSKRYHMQRHVWVTSGNDTAGTCAFWKELVFSGELDQRPLKTTLVITEFWILGFFFCFLRDFFFPPKQSYPTTDSVSLLSQHPSNLIPLSGATKLPCWGTAWGARVLPTLVCSIWMFGWFSLKSCQVISRGA